MTTNIKTTDFTTHYGSIVPLHFETILDGDIFTETAKCLTCERITEFDSGFADSGFVPVSCECGVKGLARNY